jgi:hypothetical protein
MRRKQQPFRQWKGGVGFQKWPLSLSSLNRWFLALPSPGWWRLAPCAFTEPFPPVGNPSALADGRSIPRVKSHPTTTLGVGELYTTCFITNMLRTARRWNLRAKRRLTMV